MDMYTLHIEHAVLLGLLTLLTAINCRLHDGAHGAYWFPAYTFCAFVGSVFVALRGHGVPDAASIVLGVTFFHLAYLFLHRGLAEFFPREGPLSAPFVIHVILILLAFVAVLRFGAIHPNTKDRAIVYSVIFSLQTALIAGIVFRKARGHLLVPGMLMGGLLGMLSLSNLVRAYLTVREGAPANYMNSGLSQQVSLMITTVLQGAITVAFVWMTAAVLHERLEKLASTDSLTGLLNRRALEAAVDGEIELSRRKRKPLTAVLIDLDHFKQVNDRFGHAFGDRTLLEVARCLQNHMRQSDLLARVGGDEFAVVLHNTSTVDALVIAERLRMSLQTLTVAEGSAEAHVSASFGLAEVDSDTVDWDDLVRKCDKAVYAVKESGGNLAAAH